MAEVLKDSRLPDSRNSARGVRTPLLSKRLLNNIASPYGLAMISYAFFCFACLIPPSVYSHYMMEPDLMFLDPATILFYTLCVASFVVGVWLVSWLFPAPFVGRSFDSRISSTLFLLAPLTLAIAAAIITDLYLITNYPTIILSLLAQQGGDVKGTITFDVDGHLAFVPLILIGVTWWAFWRHSDLGLQGWRRSLVRLSLFVAVLSIIVSSILTLNRNVLTLAVCGLAVSYLVRRALEKQISVKFVVRSGLAIVIVIALLFFAFSFLSGIDTWDDQFSMLVGYTAASYNRLAAIVNGNLRYPFAGHGMYLSSVVAHNHMLLSGYLNSPDAIEVWASEFGAVSRAGLNGTLIWSGAFGYIFSDLGWFSLPFVFGYGMLYGFTWNWIKRGKALGVVLYPWFGFCALFWMGFNYLFDQPVESFLLVAIILTGYEFVFVKRSQCRRRTEAIFRDRRSS